VGQLKEPLIESSHDVGRLDKPFFELPQRVGRFKGWLFRYTCVYCRLSQPQDRRTALRAGGSPSLPGCRRDRIYSGAVNGKWRIAMVSCRRSREPMPGPREINCKNAVIT
jgi:hypothetical protein